MINLEKEACCPDESTCCKDVAHNVIASDLKFTSTRTSELLTTQLGDVRAHSRITLKRVTNSSRSISAGQKISFVHSSTVTTTWSGSRPSVEGLTVDKDGHAVLGFDLFNKIPSNGDLFGWVNDLDSLIKDQNIGLKEQQVGTDNSGATNSCCGHKVSTVNNGLNNEAGEEENQNPTASDSATGPELFNVGHFASFSQMGSIK